MNHFYRALTFLLCLMAFNSWANTPPKEDFFTLCADRTASNTTLCMDGNYQGTRYGGYILFKDLENHYKLENGKFREFQDGTARLTGQWINIGRSDVKFDVDIHFSGRTANAPNDPKEHHCFDNVNTDAFYYYTHTSGTLTGRDKVNGAKFEVSRFGPAMQVGIGANVTNRDLNFGASGWLSVRMISQSSTSLKLTLQTSTVGGNGDININLSGNGSACFDSDISFNCLDDITRTAEFGQNGVAVNWNVPTATTTCMIGGGSNCPSNNIDGFVYMGQKNGSKYYCSKTNETYTKARELAMAAGGHLAVICSSTENDYIRSKIDPDVHVVWIGYSDEMTEGTFLWTNGETCNYTKWASGEPNDLHSSDQYSGADHTVLRQSDGKWLDRNKRAEYEFVMEIPCESTMEPGNVTVTQIEGPAPGSVIPVGMTTVKYEATDECGNREICEFKITVNEPVDPCAGNGSPMAEVEGQDPDCGLNNGKIKFTFADNDARSNIEFSIDGGQTYPLNVQDNAGMAMFSDLDPGTYQLSVRWGNGDCPKSLGSITLEDSRQTPGMVCDDNDPTTLNDVIQDDGCTCEGVPVGEIDLVCEDDITITAGPGEEGAIIIFDEPTASTTCALGGLNIQQTEGPTSGSLFPIGMTTVVYRVSDACGNMERCSFKVTVEETPLMLDILCADDIVVTAAVGEDGAVVTFNEPSIITNCSNDFINVSILEGLPSGSTFPVGTTEVTFLVEDGCDQRETCSFLVTVNPAPTGDIDFICNDDIEVTAAVGDNSAVVTYTEPTASTTCPLGGLNVERTQGLASGSDFPVGTSTVIYTATDACGGIETCSFTITVNPAPTGDIDFTCVDDITVSAAPGATSAVVTYSGPRAITTCPLGGLQNSLVEGFLSGSEFPLGETVVTYVATDACGGLETCTFKVTVNPAPTGEISLTCNDDITVFAAPGANSAIVTYTEPTASTTCPLDGLNVGLVEGLVSGSEFPVGVTIVTYIATDACGSVEECTFKVRIEPTFIEPCINSIEILNKVCDNNGTPSDPTDDTYSFDLRVIGGGSAAATYQGSYDNAFWGAFNFAGAYGEIVTLGPFPAGPFTSNNTNPPVTIEGGLDINVSVTDDNDPNCTDNVVVESPGPCSNEEPKGSIGDFVFFDVNGNGIQDPEDLGIDGITVKLQDADGNTLTTTSTSNGGKYSFQEVEAGEYKIMVNAPSGNELSPADQGDNDDKDSDILANGMTEVFTLAVGQDINNIDAGLVRPIVSDKAKVGDFVFRDNNGNGLQDDGEPGIGGVSVVLYDGDGAIKGYMVTPDNGMYMFGDLEPGDYRIKFVGQPGDLTVTTQDVGNNDAIDSDIDFIGFTEEFTLVGGEFNEDIDAGFKPRNVEPDPARIGNQVFQDLNGNGVKDDSEPGIEGVTVKLLAANGDELQSTTTGQNGMYSFGVPAGSYIVMFNTPDNFNPVNQTGNATDGIDNDSDSDPLTGMTEAFTVTAGESNATIDAGFVAQTEPCDNITNPGKIAADENPDACGPYDPAEIISLEPASGGTGEIEYIWLASTVECSADLTNIIPGATGETYDPGVISQTTYFRRCARRVGCTVWIETDCIVKTVRPCEPTGPVDCDIIAATVDGNKVTVDGIHGNNALVQIIGAPINWELRTLCGGDQPACGTSTMMSDLPEGAYEIKVQLWGEDGSYCYRPIPITITGGDPVCTVDGGTISTNDDITDLCVDDNVPSMVNFTAAGGSGANSAWIVTDANGTILNADAPSSINFDGAGAGACNVYYVRYDDISGLANNNNISDLEGCFDLSNAITVTRQENCGDPGCTVDGGTISTNDNITDLCVDDNEPSMVNFTAAGGSGANSAWIVTDANGTILNADAPSSINFDGAGAGACNVYYVRYDNISGLANDNNISDLEGCFDLSNVITVTRRENCDGGGEPQCEDASVTTSAGKINISGLTAPFVIVKVQDVDNGWGIVADCVDCNESVSFDLPEGNYNVTIEFYRGFWNDKYCRRDVRVTVTNDGPCADVDGDGVCRDQDCDDNDASVGAKLPVGTSCDDGNPNTIDDQIQSDGCTCEGTEEVDPGKEICAERDVFNTDNCQFNIVYGLYLKLEGYDEYYTVSDASFVEYTDGTAEYTATAINNTTPGIKWAISAQFGQRTTLAEVAPKYHNCITVNTDDFYFYEQLSGTLTGMDDAAGAKMNIMRIGPAFQVGVGANITHKFFDFGGSGWFVGDLVSQPTNIEPFNVLAGAQGQNGDFNMNFSGDGTECIDDRDNSELDCANVEVSAGNGNITIEGLTAPIEIVKVFNADWAPIFECIGDCGPTIEVPATEGNYLVRVSFYTANWVGECDVEFPVTMGANGVSASSRTAPQLNFNSYEVEREVALEWTTNTGYKNDKYIIEKSTDGEKFEAIEEIANEITKGEFAYYKGLDATPTLGENYYRVKQVYQDGTFDYTDIQVVNFNIDLTELSVFPNPAQNELFINLEDYAGQTGSLQIANAYGQVVTVMELDIIPAQAIKVDLNDFQNGLYHLSVGLEKGQTISKKILVSKLY